MGETDLQTVNEPKNVASVEGLFKNVNIWETGFSHFCRALWHIVQEKLLSHELLTPCAYVCLDSWFRTAILECLCVSTWICSLQYIKLQAFVRRTPKKSVDELQVSTCVWIIPLFCFNTVITKTTAGFPQCFISQQPVSILYFCLLAYIRTALNSFML